MSQRKKTWTVHLLVSACTARKCRLFAPLTELFRSTLNSQTRKLDYSARSPVVKCVSHHWLLSPSADNERQTHFASSGRQSSFLEFLDHSHSRSFSSFVKIQSNTRCHSTYLRGLIFARIPERKCENRNLRGLSFLVSRPPGVGKRVRQSLKRVAPTYDGHDIIASRSAAPTSLLCRCEQDWRPHVAAGARRAQGTALGQHVHQLGIGAFAYRFYLVRFNELDSADDGDRFGSRWANACSLSGRRMRTPGSVLAQVRKRGAQAAIGGCVRYQIEERWSWSHSPHGSAFTGKYKMLARHPHICSQAYHLTCSCCSPRQSARPASARCLGPCCVSNAVPFSAQEIYHIHCQVMRNVMPKLNRITSVSPFPRRARRKSCF